MQYDGSLTTAAVTDACLRARIEFALAPADVKPINQDWTAVGPAIQ